MRVFMSCKPYVETGGIELLHQLAEQLNKRGIEAYIVYNFDVIVGCDPTPQAYKKYGAKIADKYYDAEDSIYIFPETYVAIFADTCKKGKAVVWWMSVDNYLEAVSGRKDIVDFKNKDMIHFVQSCYAEHFVKEELGVKTCYYLSDYISNSISEYGEKNRSLIPKENICLFNPQKGRERILQLVQKSPQINWVPIQGLSPEGVAELLCKAKVYIDLGNHPGKDRIPREAAYCGCAILTNRNGSAAYFEDVSIPDKYKVQDSDSDEEIISKIEDLMENYEERKLDYLPYIEKISQEKQVFEQEIDQMVAILQKEVPKRDKSIEEKNTVIQYLNMMNRQMENIIMKNKQMQQFVEMDDMQSCISGLLEEDNSVREMKEEIWELLEYFAE